MILKTYIKKIFHHFIIRKNMKFAYVLIYFIYFYNFTKKKNHIYLIFFYQIQILFIFLFTKLTKFYVFSPIFPFSWQSQG